MGYKLKVSKYVYFFESRLEKYEDHKEKSCEIVSV